MDCMIITFLISFFASIVVLSDSKSGSFENIKVLSRRKRYLTFPEGSSFQLVFCLQTTALIPIGQIFLYGNTAALAWELPKDPEFYQMVKKEKAEKRVDAIYPYNKHLARKPFINPAFAKRSVEEQNVTFKEKLKIKMYRIKMHERQLDREYLNRKHMNEGSIEFHRQSRIGIYEKIEKFINALGKDGRQCVLRKLCESARTAPQGTFLSELLRTVFTLPKGKEFELEDHKEYDTAHDESNDDCSRMYPGCDFILMSL